MSFSWIPYYKELAKKLVSYRNQREELLQIIRGLEDEDVQFLRKDHDKNKISNIHPFAVFAIFNRLTQVDRKRRVLEYLKKSFNLTSSIPIDYDGIPSIRPDKSFWAMPWDNNNPNKEIEENWDLFCCAVNESFDEEQFITYFDKVIEQKDAKKTVTQALYRLNPDRFLTIDGNTIEYLDHLEMPVFDDKKLCGKEYLIFQDKVKQAIENRSIKEKNYYELSYNAWIYRKDNRNYWLIGPGDYKGAWEDSVASGTISIGWGWTGDINNYTDKKSFVTNFNKIFKDKNNPKKSKTRSANDVWRFAKEIKENDIIFAKDGLFGIYGVGTVFSEYYYDDSYSEEYAHFHYVKWDYIKHFDYPHYIQKTITELDKAEGDRIMAALNKEKNRDTIELSELLRNNHNIILHGAPGTGKTYYAKDIAAQIICKKSYAEIQKNPEDIKLFNDQVELVQFHPSYDYSDFVEGLRPIEGNNAGEIGFIRKDGTFKMFCERALTNLNDSKKSKKDLANQLSFVNAFNLLCDKIQNEEITEITLRNGKTKMNVLGVNDNSSVIYLQTQNSSAKPYTFSLNLLKKLSEVFSKRKDLDDISNIDNEFRAVIGGCHSSGYWGVLNAIYELRDKQENGTNKKQDNDIEVSEKEYVFIIDEINRGEISKIFGELFLSIDPDYRGTDGKVRTQYANMMNGPSLFDIVANTSNYGYFFVPENVYIIGTMNDIDRSVESMDFAMRRRFTFVELKADECLGMLEDVVFTDNSVITVDEIIKKMKALNYKIENEPGLSSAYHIGGSYFKKLTNYTDKDKDKALEMLWDNHLKPLISDYLKGIPKLDEKLKEFKSVYDDPDKTLQQINTNSND